MVSYWPPNPNTPQTSSQRETQLTNLHFQGICFLISSFFPPGVFSLVLRQLSLTTQGGFPRNPAKRGARSNRSPGKGSSFSGSKSCAPWNLASSRSRIIAAVLSMFFPPPARDPQVLEGSLLARHELCRNISGKQINIS